MDDPGVVRLGDSLRRLNRDFERAADRQRAFQYQLPNGLPVDELRDDVGPRLHLADFVNRQNVRVVERGGRLRFRDESPQPVAIGRRVSGQDLDRDLASQPRIARLPHLAHPAGSEAEQDLVGTDAARRPTAVEHGFAQL